MLNIPEIPKLPEKEDLEYKQKEFFLSLYEQFQSSSKFLLYALVLVVIAAIPLKLGAKFLFTRTFIAAYRPPTVNTIPYTPALLEILQANVLPIDQKSASAVAQVLNPNSEISAYFFDYKFSLLDENGITVSEVIGEGFIQARESKFLFAPVVSSNPLPSAANLSVSNIRWTKRPAADIKFEILQKNSGRTFEGNFFVDGLLKNSQGFGLKRVQVNAIVFDLANQNIIAVNETVLTDIKPFESRYFRMIWPRNYQGFGEIQVVSSLNLLDPGLILEKSRAVPIR
ncbi:MAG: hypothetical protein Q8R08_02915 [bacterium]|nr:hypothetical protein [bacterium]